MGVLSESCSSVSSEKEHWAPLLKARHQEWHSLEDLDLLDLTNRLSFEFDQDATIQIAPLEQIGSSTISSQCSHKTNIKKLLKMLMRSNHLDQRRNKWMQGFIKNRKF